MYSEISSNKRKTIILILLFVAFIGFLSYFAGIYYGDYSVTIMAVVFSVIYVLFSYFAAAKTALMFNGAEEIQKRDNPRLWRIIENIAITEGLPMPRVYIIDDTGLNAFATGRDPSHSHVAITSGLLSILDDSELEGVMAHELGHVKNYDIRVSMVVFGLVMLVSVLADIFLRISWFGGRNSDDDSDSSSAVLMIFGFVAMIIAPLVAAVIQAAISRKREYLADATSAMTTRYPDGLARALEKLRDGNTGLRRQNASTAHLFFANPLKGKSFSTLFSTHPSIDDRIAKLKSMGSKL